MRKCNTTVEVLKQGYEQSIEVGGGYGGEARKGFLEESRGKLNLRLLNVHISIDHGLATFPWGCVGLG